MRKLSRRNVGAILILLLTASVVTAAVASTPVTNNSDGTVLTAPSGPSVTLVGNTDIATTSGGDTNVVRWNTTAGNASFESQGSADATINKDDLTGTWTVVTAIDATSNDLTINPGDKQPVTVGGDIDSIEFRDPQLDDGDVDFVYAGDSGTSTVTVQGLTADTQVRAVDTDTGDVLDISTTDSNGQATFSMENSEHSVELQTGAGSPILSDPQPDGNVSTQPSEFSVYVEDSDFPGDTVDVEFFYEGSSIDNVSTSSDGRVSTSNVPQIASGVHEWSAVATDSNGNQDIINATVGIPGTLYIRNETAPDELVDSPVEVTVSFENGTAVETITTTDGTVNMSGLPTTDFIVTAEASSDYYQRTVYFQSIIGDQSVYLLNQSISATESRFVLDDPTGEYPDSSFLIIKKAINRSGENKYRTIYSDRFGTEGVTADLESDERYQISIRSPNGQVQYIGPYRADVAETITVQPGTPTIELDDYEDGWAAAAELNNRTLEYRYDDPENETTQLTLWIHEKGNTSNRLRPNATFYDLGAMSGTYTLNANNSKKTWVVNYVVDRGNEEFTIQKEVSNRPDLVPDLSSEWRLIIGISMLLVSAGIFSMLNAALGGVIVSIEGGILWYIGWLEGATSGAAVVIALFVSVLVHLYSR